MLNNENQITNHLFIILYNNNNDTFVHKVVSHKTMIVVFGNNTNTTRTLKIPVIVFNG